jgi:hypothetical protein
MRYLRLAILFVVAGSFPVAADLRDPLEKQFFDYFTQRCNEGLAAEAKSQNLDITKTGVAEGINKYCSCTSQAVVSYLTAEEMISFAVDATRDPASSKMKPYFEQCRGK